MDTSVNMPIGQRVANIRKLRGLTQAGLALRMNRSASWVTKVERGDRRIDSMAVMHELATALRVPVHQLTGRQDVAYGDSGISQVNGYADLRRVLDRSGWFASHSLPDTPRDATALNEAALSMRRRYNTATHNVSAIAPQLAGLVTEAQVAVADASSCDRPLVNSSLSTLYRVASLAFRQSGDLPRARLAVDRALMAAEESDDALRVSSILATMTVQLMIQGDPDDAVSLAIDAVDHSRREPMMDTASGHVILGALNLYAAQAAARAGDAAEARKLLNRANALGDKLGGDTESYCLIFGPTNVAIQEAGILVDLGEPSKAIALAETVHPERLGSVNRSGYHYLHLARAYGQLGDDGSALRAVYRANRVAPELVLHDPLARDLVRYIATHRRHYDENLRALVRTLNVMP